MTTKKNHSAFASEIFSSIQGEGVNIGRRQLFVRFCECHRNCLYCDTPIERTETVAIEREPGSGQFDPLPNPLSADQLLKIIQEMNPSAFSHDDLFITGGEPLLQAKFLAELLPQIKPQLNLPIHLETSGDLVEPFKEIAPWIGHVLMDIKLPSVTGEPETWEQHQQFIEAVKKYEMSATIKLVISADTSDSDLAESVELITATGTDADVVLQPMTAASKTDRVPTARQVLEWQAQMANALGRTVRVIPQSHKLMGLL